MSRALRGYAGDIDRAPGSLARKPGCAEDCAVFRRASRTHGERGGLFEARGCRGNVRVFARRVVRDGCCNDQAACSAPQLAEHRRLRDDASRVVPRSRARAGSSGSAAEERLEERFTLLRRLLPLAILADPHTSVGL